MFENSIFSSLEEKKVNFLNWDLYYLQSEFFRIISSWCIMILMKLYLLINELNYYHETLCYT